MLYAISAPRYVESGASYDMTVTVSNNTTGDTISGFAVELTIDGNTYTSSTYNGQLAPNFLAPMTISGVNLANNGEYDADFRIINNANDNNSNNDESDLKITAVDELVPRNDLVEIATGRGCGYCPLKDVAKDDISAVNPNTIYVEYHNSIFGADPLDNAGSKLYHDDYNAGSTPSATVNREEFPDWEINGVIMHPVEVERRFQDGYANVGAPVSLSISSTFTDAPPKLKSEITVEAVSDLEGDVRVVAMLIENGIPATGNLAQRNYDDNNPNSPLFGLGNPMDNYSHDNTFRLYLTPFAGVPVSTDSSLAKGETFTLEVDTLVDNINQNTDNMEIVAFAYRNNTFNTRDRSVMNALKSDLNTAVTSRTEDEGLRLGVYPNPASDIVNVNYWLESTSQIEVTLTNNLGQRVYRSSQNEVAGARTQHLHVETLPAGLYHLTIATETEQLSRKIVIQ